MRLQFWAKRLRHFASLVQHLSCATCFGNFSFLLPSNHYVAWFTMWSILYLWLYHNALLQGGEKACLRSVVFIHVAQVCLNRFFFQDWGLLCSLTCIKYINAVGLMINSLMIIISFTTGVKEVCKKAGGEDQKVLYLLMSDH